MTAKIHGWSFLTLQHHSLIINKNLNSGAFLHGIYRLTLIIACICWAISAVKYDYETSSQRESSADLLLKESANKLYSNRHYDNRFRRILSDEKSKKMIDSYSDLSWEQLSNKTFDSNRKFEIGKTLSQVAGVYFNKSKSKDLNIEKTVLVNVLSININKDIDSKYLELLRNWYCFAKQHGLKPLTYIVPSIEHNYTQQVDEFRSLGLNGSFAPYPTSLFWKIVSKKKTSIMGGRHRVSYAGSTPTFKHFGALVMLVPIFEVLELGYDAVYFDLDIAFVRDPIPDIVKGSADLAVSMEMRTCILPSVLSIAKLTTWKDIEPNTGVMIARSTAKGIDFFQRWLDKIVQDNVNNDQKALLFDELGSKMTFNCNPSLEKYAGNELKSFIDANASASHRHCFLNEFLYQNGKVAFGCAFGKGGSQHEYVLGMVEQGFTREDPDTKTKERQMAPVLVHANYCDQKIDEFKNLGLWLAPDFLPGVVADTANTTEVANVIDTNPGTNGHLHCKYYNFSETTYVKTDWNVSITNAMNDIDEVKSKLVNGSLVRLFRKPSIYLVMDGVLHPFPNHDTITAMGYSWNQINHLRAYNFIKFLPVAPQELPELPPLTLAPSAGSTSTTT